MLQPTEGNHEACPERKDTKVLNMYNILNLEKRHCEWIACSFIQLSVWRQIQRLFQNGSST
jgi:hypothetical protein